MRSAAALSVPGTLRTHCRKSPQNHGDFGKSRCGAGAYAGVLPNGSLPVIRQALRSAVVAGILGIGAVGGGSALLIAEPGSVVAWLDRAAGDVSQMLTVPSLPTSADAEAVIEGVARVLDGQTIEINGRPVRLAGLAVPEELKHCGRRDQQTCTTAAMLQLQQLIATVPVRCRVEQADGSQLVGTCYTGTEDVGRELVRTGYARAYRAYSDRYVDDEIAAEAMQRGHWQARP